MSAASLLDELRRRGVRLEAAGDRLRVNAPKGVVTERLRQRLAAHKEEILLLLGAPGPGAEPRLERVPRDRPLPLSFAQERLWFLDRLGAGGVPYNIPLALRISGPLDAARLERALALLVERHEVFRTACREERGRPALAIAPRVEVALTTTTLPGVPDTELTAILQEEARRPFDLGVAPILRARLFQSGGGGHVLLLVTHHLVADGWSMRILVRDLAAIYHSLTRGEPAALPELSVQYADFAVWQRRYLAGERLERDLRYWRPRLAEPPPPLDLPFARPRPGIRSGLGRTARAVLGGDLTERARAMARRRSSTLFMVMSTGFLALLARYTGRRDLAFATAVSSRPRSELEPLIGCFINDLVLRCDLSGDPDFVEALERVREVAIGAFAHQDLPFEKLVEELQPRRDLDRTPLFQAMLVLENAPGGEVDLGGLRMEPIPLELGTSRFDLTLSLTDGEDGLAASLEYDADRFAAEDAGRLLEHYRTLLAAAVAEPGRRLSQLALLPDAERRAVVNTWNATARDYGPPRSLVDLLEAQAARTPEARAVGFQGETLTYRQLDGRAGRLARRLIAEGAGPETVVGVAMERSVDVVVALLGVLKAGAAYLPLDPENPPDRIASMMEDAAVRCLLTQRHLAGILPVRPGVRALVTGGDEPREDAAERRAAPVDPDTCAYVIYTSGSTGRPKGVMVSHRAIVNRLLWMQETFAIGTRDRVAQKTPLSFDVSVWELFWPLMAGARLEMAPPQVHRDPVALSAWIADTGVSVIHFVPSMLRSFLDHGDPDRCGSLRLVMASGEALAPDVVERFHSRLGAELHNLYGPTEAAVDVTHWPCRRGDGGGPVPIGRPIANLRILVLDEGMQPAPAGVPGELCIGGVGLARCYLRRPALTAERFVPDPDGGEAGARLYRTGDLARWRPDGVLEFLGRRDHQVKIRGFRVELGEIEAALADHPEVAQAVVVVREVAAGDQRLAAYVVPVEGSRPVADALREHLAARLPAPMVPGPIVFLHHLPLTSTGKVDRAALPAPAAAEEEGRQERVPPATPAEEVLAGIYADLLGIEEVAASDDFFALGGHSLLAAQLVARVREAFGTELPLRAVFKSPRVDALAREIASRDRGGKLPPLEAISRRDELPMSAVQERLWFLDRFDPGTSALNVPLGLRLRGPVEQEALAEALQGVVDRHEILHVTFHEREGRPVQRRHAAMAVPLPVLDLRGRRVESAEGVVQEHAEAEAAAPFDLARAPLLRARLLRLAEEEHVLLLTAHHIVADGWSAGLVVQELAELYRARIQGGRARLAALPYHYADFAAWQARRLRDEILRAKLSYWKEALAGAPDQLELPLDHPRPPLQSFRGARVERALRAQQVGRLKELARQAGATPFMALLSLFAVLLQRWSGQPEVVIGAPVAGRPYPELDHVVGPFLDTVALRVGCGDGHSFRQLLGQVREAVLAALQHADVPFERVLETVQPTRDPSRTPIFQVFLNMLNFPAPQCDLPGLQVELLAPPSPPSKFDLTLYVAEEAAEIRCHLVYNADLLDRPRMEELLDQLALLAEQVVEDPDRSMISHSLVTPRARRSLPDPHAPLDASWPGPVHEEVQRRAQRNPSATAVVDRDGSWSYGEVVGAADSLARELGGRGVGRSDVVAVYAHRSAALVASILAVLRAGGAVALLDPAYPARRLRQYLELVSPVALLRLVQAGPLPVPVAELLSGSPACPVIDVPPAPGWWRAEARGNGVAAPAVDAEADDTAFVSFTSGSTGEPKAIAGAHRSLTHFLAWQQRAFQLSAGDRYSLLSGLSHDPLQRDVFTALCTGATLCIPDPEEMGTPGWLPEWAAREGITVAHLTPAMARLLAEPRAGRPVSVPSLRWAFLVGEVLTRNTVRRLRRVAPCVRCVNLYGATETQRAVGYSVVEKAPGDFTGGGPQGKETIPLGRGAPDVQLLLRGMGDTLAGVGELGEILVRSPHLAKGYLGRPERTRERFPPNPFASDAQDRVYLTGDLGRYLADGTVEWAGRADRQVKLRGFRVEPGEIEAVLQHHPGVETAAVVLRNDLPPEPQLVAYIQPQGVPAPDPGRLRGFLAERLPAHLIPSRFVEVERIPLSPNGKVAYAALPEPPAATEESRDGYVSPRDDVELRLARIWEEVLERRPVGVREDFFALGGHSLLAVRLASRIEVAFGERLPLAAIFRDPTVERMAARLRAGGEGTERTPLVPIQPEGRRLPLLCVHPVGGTVLCYQGLARCLGREQPFFGLEAAGVGGERLPLRRVEEMAARYLAALRLAGIGGPYQLAGWSFGGLVAFEMARRLREGGEDVALLALLDSWPPGSLGDQETAADNEATLLRLMARTLGDLSGRPLELEIEELQALPDREARLALVVSRAQALRVLPPEVGVEQIHPLVAVVEANLEARREYTPGFYGSEILLLRAAVPAVAPPPDDPTVGWGRLAAAVEVVTVPGDHYSMLAEPNVRQVARRLAERLCPAAALETQ